MQCSIIIPTLNESENIGDLIRHLQEGADERLADIIVVDAGSKDDTVGEARSAGARVLTSTRGRALQMNLGADATDSEILYFVHADTRPPLTYLDDIEEAIAEGYDMGCYRFKFNSRSKLLAINSYFTRFGKMWCRGGDQSLFMKSDVFYALGGYKEEYVIMEEYDLLRRAVDQYKFKLIPKDIIVSARKYEDNNYLRVQFANLVVFNMFKWGYEPQRLLNTYRRLISYRG